MSELGQYLKQKRLEQDISIEKLQEQTKIRKRYIEAIETGDYRVLPGQFYARAFIKSYAEAIGLNGEQVLAEYAHELPQIPKAPVESPVPEKRQKRVKTRSPKVSKWVTRIVLYAFLFVIGFFIYYAFVIFSEQRNTVDPLPTPGIEGDQVLPDDMDDPVEDQDPAETNEPEPEPTEQEPPPEPEFTFIETRGSNYYYEYRNAETFEVTILPATGDVWYELRNHQTNAVIETTTLRYGRNDEATFDLTELEEVYIRFGNTLNLSLLINGEEVDVPRDPPGPKNLIIQFHPLTGDEE